MLSLKKVQTLCSSVKFDKYQLISIILWKYTTENLQQQDIPQNAAQTVYVPAVTLHHYFSYVYCYINAQ